MAGNFDDFFLAGTEYLLPLSKAGGVIQMHHSTFDSLQGFEGFFYNMASCLGQNLYGYVIRNQVLFNQLP